MVVSSNGSSFISIFRNTGSIGNILFGPQQNFPSNNSCIGLAIGDLDGDGKLDIAEACSSVGSVSLFRNISAVGNISFAPLVDLSASSMTRLVSIADFDGDGMLEMAWHDYSGNIYMWDLPGKATSQTLLPWPMYQHDAEHTGIFLSSNNPSPMA